MFSSCFPSRLIRTNVSHATEHSWNTCKLSYRIHGTGFNLLQAVNVKAFLQVLHQVLHLHEVTCSCCTPLCT